MAPAPALALRETLGRLNAALVELKGLPAAEFGALPLVAGIDELLTAETVLRAVQADWLAVAAATAATVDDCGRSTRSWLIEEAHLGPAEASRRMRLAHGLVERPAVRAAIRTGEVTAEHAGIVLKAVAPVTSEHRDAVEAALLDIARVDPPVDVLRAVERVRATVEGDDADARALRRYEQRSLSVSETFDGTGSLSGTLTSTCREKFRVALRAVTGGLPGADDTRNQPQRNHDGVEEILDFYLAHAALTAPETGERPRVVVTLSYDQLIDALSTYESELRDGLLHPPGVNGASAVGDWPRFDSGAPVDPTAARRIACSAGILPAVLDGVRDVLDLGRTSRQPSLAQRRAAKLRDGGRCARHGCRRRITDLHHIRWWSRSGPTDLANLVWLCTFHHHLLHEGRWTIRRLAPGRYLFTDPEGREHGPPPDTGSPPPTPTPTRQTHAA